MLKSSYSPEELYATRLRLPDALVSEWDASELIETANRAIGESESSFEAGIGHEILAFCLEDEGGSPDVVIDHFRQAEEAYFESGNRSAAILAGHAQVERLTGSGMKQEGSDVFVRLLDYWEEIPSSEKVPPDTRKALDRSFNLVKRKRVSLKGWREQSERTKDDADEVRGLLIQYRFFAELRGISEKAGTFEEVERFGEAVLAWSDDGLIRAHAYEMLAANYSTRVYSQESLRFLRKAEDEYARMNWPFGAVEKAGEETALLLGLGHRSDAIQSFIRQLDHWLAFDHTEYSFQQNDRVLFWRAEHDIDTAYKAITNRTTKRRQRDD